MARSEFMSIAIVAIVLAISFKHASALKCWVCSSDGTQNDTKFCQDPFDKSVEQNKANHWAYSDCGKTEPGHNFYCKKAIDIVNEKTLVVDRKCILLPANSAEAKCNDNTLKTVENKVCLLCTEDGCNSAVQFTSTIAFLTTSLMIAHILSA